MNINILKIWSNVFYVNMLEMGLFNIECFDVFDLYDVVVDYELFFFIWFDIRLFFWLLKYRIKMIDVF